MICLSQAAVTYEEKLVDTGGTKVNHTKWQLIQSDVPVIKNMIMLLKQGSKPCRDQQHQREDESPELKIYLKDWDKFSVRGGVLRRRRINQDGKQSFQPVLPAEKTDEALTGLHDQLGHIGRTRIMDLVRA